VSVVPADLPRRDPHHAVERAEHPSVHDVVARDLRVDLDVHEHDENRPQLGLGPVPALVDRPRPRDLRSDLGGPADALAARPSVDVSVPASGRVDVQCQLSAEALQGAVVHPVALDAERVVHADLGREGRDGHGRVSHPATGAAHGSELGLDDEVGPGGDDGRLRRVQYIRGDAVRRGEEAYRLGTRQ